MFGLHVDQSSVAPRCQVPVPLFFVLEVAPDLCHHGAVVSGTVAQPVVVVLQGSILEHYWESVTGLPSWNADSTARISENRDLCVEDVVVSAAVLHLVVVQLGKICEVSGISLRCVGRFP
jgi:hypothetical protein